MNTTHTRDDEARAKQIAEARDALLNAIGERDNNAVIAIRAIKAATKFAVGDFKAADLKRTT